MLKIRRSHRNPHTWKRWSLYWDGALVFFLLGCPRSIHWGMSKVLWDWSISKASNVIDLFCLTMRYAQMLELCQNSYVTFNILWWWLDFIKCYSDITWVSWHVKSPGVQLFIQLFMASGSPHKGQLMLKTFPFHNTNAVFWSTHELKNISYYPAYFLYQHVMQKKYVIVLYIWANNILHGLMDYSNKVKIGCIKTVQPFIMWLVWLGLQCIKLTIAWTFEKCSKIQSFTYCTISMTHLSLIWISWIALNIRCNYSENIFLHKIYI